MLGKTAGEMKCRSGFAAFLTFLSFAEFALAAMRMPDIYSNPWVYGSQYSTPQYNPTGSHLPTPQPPQEMPILLSRFGAPQQSAPITAVQYTPRTTHVVNEEEDNAMNLDVGKELLPFAGAAAKTAVDKATYAIKRLARSPPTLWKVVITFAVFCATFYLAGIIAGLLRLILAAYIAFKAFDIVENGEHASNAPRK